MKNVKQSWQNGKRGQAVTKTRESNRPSRLGAVEALEPRLLLAGPEVTGFNVVYPSRTTARFDGDGNLLKVTGPEAGLLQDGMLGAAAQDPVAMVVRFDGPVRGRTVQPSDLKLRFPEDVSVTNPIHAYNARTTNKKRVVFRLRGDLPDGAGDTMSARVNGIRGLEPVKTAKRTKWVAGPWMEPWLQTFQVNADSGNQGGGTNGGGNNGGGNNGDSVGPQVVSVSPGPGEFLAEPPGEITAVFSEDLDPATVNSAHFKLVGSGGDHQFDDGNELNVFPTNVTYDAGSRTARFEIGGRLPSDTYMVRLVGSTSIQDISGNHLDGNGDGNGGDDFSSTFQLALTPLPDPNPGPQKDSIIGGDPPDPAGDLFPNAPNPALDINFIAGFRDSDDLFLNVRFENAIEAPSANEPNSVFGFVDLDLDADTQTGLPIDRTPQPLSPSPGLGVDFFVDIGSEARHRGFAEVIYADGPADRIPLSGDMDGDIDSDLVIYRPRFGDFLIGENSAGSLGLVQGPFSFGPANSIPFLGDWDPDGPGPRRQDDVLELGAYDPATGRFFLDLNGNRRLGPGETFDQFNFNLLAVDPNDQPLVGDWDSDGDDDIGLYDADGGRFLLDNDGNQISNDAVFTFGPASATNVAVVGDWNFNGADEVGVFIRGEDLNGNGSEDAGEDLNGNGVFDTALGVWFLDFDGDQFQDINEDANNNRVLDPGEDLNNDGRLDNEGAFGFGRATDTPIVGAWSISARDDIGVHRTTATESQFFLDLNSDQQVNATEGPFRFGQPGDVPVIGRYDFDLDDDIGVYRPQALDGSFTVGDQFFLDGNGNRSQGAFEGPFQIASLVPIEFLATSLSVKIPLTVIGEDDGLLRFHATVGPPAGFSDEAPNPGSPAADTGNVTPVVPGCSIGVVDPNNNACSFLNFADGDTFRDGIDPLPFSTIAIAGTSVVQGTVGLQVSFAGGDIALLDEDLNNDGVFNDGVANATLDETADGVAVDYDGDRREDSTSVSEDLNGNGIFDRGINAIIDPESVNPITVGQQDNVTLVGSGGDGTFFDGNEVLIAAKQIVTGSSSPLPSKPIDTVFFDLTGVSLGPDLYRFRVRGDDPVRDPHGIPIDGDDDGEPEGDFVVEFRIDGPPEIVSLRLTSPADSNVDPNGDTPGDTGVVGDGITADPTPNYVGTVQDDLLSVTSDLPGDTFGFGPFQPDIVEANAEINPDSQELNIAVRFGSDVTLASLGAQNAALGFIDIDADRSPSTGATGWVLDLNGSGNEEFGEGVTHIGLFGDQPVVGQWDSLGQDRLGVYRPDGPDAGLLMLDIDGDQRISAAEMFNSGVTNGVPLVGDFNDDGDDDIAIYHLGEDLNENGVLDPNEDVVNAGVLDLDVGVWVVDVNGDRNFDLSSEVFGFGTGLTGTTIPVVGNWNGLGPDNIGMFDQATAIWTLDDDGNFSAVGETPFIFGSGSGQETPVTGDWAGEGRTEVGTYDPRLSQFRIDNDGNRLLEGGEGPFIYGDAFSTPVIGDWNDDGTDDIGTYNTTVSFFGAQWFLDLDATRTPTPADGPFTFGERSDIPVVGDWEDLGGADGDRLGVFRDTNSSHLSSLGRGNSGLGIDLFIDLSSEQSGVVNLHRASTSEVLAAVPIELFPDGQTITVTVPLDLPGLPADVVALNDGDVNFGALVGTQTEFTDQIPEGTGGFGGGFGGGPGGGPGGGIGEPGGIRSTESILVEFEVQITPNIFNEGRTRTRGLGTFTLSVPSNQDVNGDGVLNDGRLHPILDEVADLIDYNRDGDRLDVGVSEDLNADGLFNDGVLNPLLSEATDGVDYNNDGDQDDQVSEDLDGNRRFNNGVTQPLLNEIADAADYNGDGVQFNDLINEDLNGDGEFNDGNAGALLNEVVDQIDYNLDGDRLDVGLSEDLNGDGQFNNGIRAALLNEVVDGVDYNGDGLQLNYLVSEDTEIPEIPFHRRPHVVKVRATDSSTNVTILHRGVRFDQTPPRLIGVVPPDNTGSNQQPLQIVVEFNDDDLDPSTVSQASSYRLVAADGTDVTSRISAVDYNEIDDRAVLTLGPGIPSGIYRFSVLGDPGGITDLAGNRLDGEPFGGEPFIDQLSPANPSGDGFPGGNFTSTLLLNFGPPRILNVTGGSGSLARNNFDTNNEDINGDGVLNADEVDFNNNGVLDLGTAAAPPREIRVEFDQPLDPATINDDTVFLTRTRNLDQITGLVSNIGDGVFDRFSDRVTGTSTLSQNGRVLTFVPDPEFLDSANDGDIEGLAPDHYRLMLVGGGVVSPRPEGQELNVAVTDDDISRPVVALDHLVDQRYQGTTSIDVHPNGPENLLIVGAEDRGLEFNLFDDQVIFSVSDDSGATWSTDVLTRTLDIPLPSGTTFEFDFDIATNPSVTFDSRGNAFVSYLLQNIEAVPDFNFNPLLPDSGYIRDAIGPLEIVSVEGGFTPTDFVFDIIFEDTVSPASDTGATSRLLGTLNINVDPENGPSEDFFVDFGDELLDPAVRQRFVTLNDSATNLEVSQRIPITYRDNKVSLSFPRNFIEAPQLGFGTNGRLDFTVEANFEDPRGFVIPSDVAPNSGPAAAVPVGFASSAVIVSRAQFNTFTNTLGAMEDPVVVQLQIHEDQDFDGLFNPAIDADINENGVLESSRFLLEAPSIAADKASFIPLRVGNTSELIPNSNLDFLYVAFGRSFLNANSGNPAGSSIFVRRSAPIEVDENRDGVADPNEDCTVDGNIDTDPTQPRCFWTQFGASQPPGLNNFVTNPRMAVGPLGDLHIVWEDFSVQGQSSILVDRSFDMFDPNLLSSDPDPLGEDRPFNPIDGGPSISDPIDFVGNNWAGADTLVAVSSINGRNDPTSLFMPQGTATSGDPRIPICDNGLRNCYSIPAQPTRGITANASVAVDTSPGPFRGRVYVAYVDTGVGGHDDTDVFLAFSDDLGANWSSQVIPTRVNDDATTTNAAQFNPSLSVDPVTGHIYLAWYDTRNDTPNLSRGRAGNVATELFFTIGIPETAGITLLQNEAVSTKAADQSLNNLDRNDLGFGDYTSIAGQNGLVYPAWSDTREILVDNTARPQVFRDVQEVMIAEIDVTNTLDEPQQTPAIRDVLGNALDGEPLGVTDDTIGMPTGDGDPGGNFVIGFVVTDQTILADSGYEEDVLFPSNGSQSNPFPTLQRAIGQANSIVLELNFTTPVQLASAGVANSISGFIDLDVDRNVLTPTLPDFDFDGQPDESSQVTRLIGFGSGLGAEFYVDLGSESRHPGVADIVDSATRRVVGTTPLQIDPSDPTKLRLRVPRNVITLGDFVPDLVNFAAVIGVDTNGSGRLEAGEVTDVSKNFGDFENTESDHQNFIDGPGPDNIFGSGDDGVDQPAGTIDITNILADHSPISPQVVQVQNGRTPGGTAIPYSIEPDPGELNGTIVVGDFTDLIVDSGVVLKMRASNLDLAGDGSNLLSRGDRDLPVIYTSLFNDALAVGGDTNGDGDNTVPNAGDYGGLVFRNRVDDTLSFVNFSRLEFGGGVVPRGGVGGLDTDIRPESVTLKDARPAVVNASFNFNSLRSAQFQENAQAAMSATPDSFQDDTIDPRNGNSAGQRGPLLRNIDFDDNSINGLLVHANHDTGEAAFTPFLQARFDDTEIVHVLTSLMRVTPGAFLKIDPSMTIKNRFGAIQVDGRGTLIAGDQGPGDAPVNFTSIFDDSDGRDTNSDGFFQFSTTAIPPAPGDWGSIFVIEPPPRINLAVAEPGLTQEVLAPGPTILIDEANIRFAGGQFVDNQVPSLGQVRTPLQIDAPGYYQITNNNFEENVGTAITVAANVLRADIPFDIATTFVDESRMNEDPLFRGNNFDANGLNGLGINTIPEAGGADLQNDKFFDLDGDGRLSLEDGVAGHWNDTDIVHVVQDTVGMPGRVLIPNETTFGVFGIRDVFGSSKEFRDRVLKVGKVPTQDLHEIDFETDAFGAPLAADRIIRNDLFNVPPFNVNLSATNGALRIEGPLGTNFNGLLSRVIIGTAIIDTPEPPFIPSSGNNVLTTTGLLGSDAMTITFNEDVFAAGFNIVSSHRSDVDESIEVVVEDRSGVFATATFPLGTFGPFVGFISAFPIRQIRFLEEPGDEDPAANVFLFDDVAIDDLIYVTKQVAPFEPTATLPAGLLTIESQDADTELLSPFQEQVEILAEAEPLVVKLNGAAPVPDAAFGAPTEDRSNIGAGFQVGMDDGIDCFLRAGPPCVFATSDWGLGSSIRLLGVAGSEASGKVRVPVVLTSLLDDREGPKGLPHDTNNDGFIPLSGPLTGFANTPSAGDWGDIFIGARSAGDRDDLLVETLLGQLTPDPQAVPGRSFTPDDPDTLRREDLIPAILDPSQGSVILNADLKYGAKIRTQGASLISHTANTAAFGQEARNGRLVNGVPDDASMVIAHSKILNMRDAGVFSNPGFFLAGDANLDDWVHIPSEPFVFNNTIAYVPELDGTNAAPTLFGVRIQGATPPDVNAFGGPTAVVMHNTVFGTQTGIQFSPDSASLAINNVLSDVLGAGVVLSLPTSEAGFNLFFNGGVGAGSNDINGNALFSDGSLFRDPTDADFRLRRFSRDEDLNGNFQLDPGEDFNNNGVLDFGGQPNPAIDVALGEFAPGTNWALRSVDDIIVRLPLPITVFNTSPLGPEQDFFGNVRQDDSRVPNPPPPIGGGAEVFFDMGALESRNFDAPFIEDVNLVLADQTIQLLDQTQPDVFVDELPAEIIVDVSEDLEPGTVTVDSVLLVPSGGDGVFQGNEFPISLVNSGGRVEFNPNTNQIRIVPAVALAEDRFRLTIRGSGGDAITDLDSTRLDGEFPGRRIDPVPTNLLTGYPTGDELPGGDYVAFFTIGIAPRVKSVTVLDDRSDPVQQLGPPRGMDADFVPDPDEFQVDNPPTSILIEFTKDVTITDPDQVFVSAFGGDGAFDQPGPITGDDVLIPGTLVIPGTNFPAIGFTTDQIEFVPRIQGTLPTDTIWRVVVDGTLNPIADSTGIQLDGEFFTGNEDLNGNGQLDIGEDRNGNNLLDDAPDLLPSGNGQPGGDFIGFFQVGSLLGPGADDAIFVNANYIGPENGLEATPFNTIQEGIDAAASTDVGTVIVLPGTYFENVSIPNQGFVTLPPTFQIPSAEDYAGITVRSRDGDLSTRISVEAGRSDANGELVDRGKPALLIRNATDIEIEGFAITTNAAPLSLIDRGGIGVVVEGSNVALTRSTIYDNQIGVAIDVISRNASATDALCSGAVRSVGQAPRLENNVVWANHQAGIQVCGQEVANANIPTAQIFNNTVVFNFEGIRLLDTGDDIAGRPNIANLLNNIVVGSTGAGIRSLNRAGAVIDFNDVFQNLGGNYVNVQRIGSHNVSVDPLFIRPVTRPPINQRPDPLAPEWRLGAFSPAADAGLGSEDINGNGILDQGEDLNRDGRLTNSPATDHDGLSRFNDFNIFDTGLGIPTFVDLGAFERQADSSGATGSITSGSGSNQASGVAGTGGSSTFLQASTTTPPSPVTTPNNPGVLVDELLTGGWAFESESAFDTTSDEWSELIDQLVKTGDLSRK